jgi:hypothetical protein
MIKLTHNDDGKGRCYSHTISIFEDDYFDNNMELFSHNPFDVAGYGDSKEEALGDFMRKFKYLMNEWVAFETMLFGTDVITDNIVEVDCFGREIEE